MTASEYVTAFAQASIGNVGVGYDMLGLAITGAGDRVSARRIDSDGIIIKEVRGLDGEIHPALSTDAGENTASLAAAALWREAGERGGVELIVHKGIPLQSGMGSSAASAVAGAVAVNALLETPLDNDALLPYAMIGEKFASGGLHADNVAPSLVGGLAGIALRVTLEDPARLIALGIIVALTVYGEFRSLSSAIERVPLLRQLDSLGRSR